MNKKDGQNAIFFYARIYLNCEMKQRSAAYLKKQTLVKSMFFTHYIRVYNNLHFSYEYLLKK